MLKQWSRRTAPVLTATALLLLPALSRAQSGGIVIQFSASRAPAANQPAFPTLLTLPLEPAAMAAVAADGFGAPYNPIAWYYPAYVPYLPPGGNFWSLAATAGLSAGPSFSASLLYELYAYTDYIQHGYGTGRPQLVPNAGMMAIIAGSPVPPIGVSEGAVLRINAPKDAKVWVNGNALKWNKQGWSYQTPKIGANDVQTVSVRAVWGSDNYEVSRNAQVVLRPGDQKSVTFLTGEGP